MLVIHILPPLVPALQGLRTLVGGGQHSSIFKYLFTNMRSFVGGVRNNGLRFRESSYYTVIDFIKGHAVMHIPRGNHGLQNKSMLTPPPTRRTASTTWSTGWTQWRHTTSGW